MFGLGEIASLIAGGGTGLIGSLVSGVTDIFKQREDNRHEEKMLQLENEHVQIEADRKVEVSQMETQAQIQEAEAEADAQVKAKSYETDQRSYLSKKAMKGSTTATILMAIVDFARGITRPAVTLYMAILATVVFLQVNEVAGDIITDEENAYQLMRVSLMAIYFYLGMCLSWWFGSRSKFMGGKGIKKSVLGEDK